MIVLTILAILCTSTLSAFALGDEQFTDVEGYVFSKDENGDVYYGYPIPLHNVYSADFPLISTFAMTDGTSAFQLDYTVEDVIPTVYTATEVVRQFTLIKGGAAAEAAGAANVGISGVTGTGIMSGASAIGAALSSASTGNIVLAAFFIGVGIVNATQPELLETVVNDIYTYLDVSIQSSLDEMYYQETWILTEDIISAINEALADKVIIKDGVVFDKSLMLSESGLTGYADQFYSDPVVINVNSADALQIEFTLSQPDAWVTIDKYNTVLYNIRPDGNWTIDGEKKPADSSSSTGWRTKIEMFNTASGVGLEYYWFDTDGSYTSYGSTKSWYIGEPVFVNDGEKVDIELVIGSKKENSSYYEFVGNTYNNIFNSVSHQHPMVLTGTGTVLDGKLITKVTYNSDTGMFSYKYKPANSGNSSSIYKYYEAPISPFHWIYSASHMQELPDPGALQSTIEHQYTDDKGKIQTDKIIEVPQIKEDEISMPKPDVETKFETDAEGNIVGNIESSTLPNTNVAPDSVTDKFDPDDDDPDDDKKWRKPFLIFELEHLFDWLPERYSKQFDSQIMIIGSAVLTLFLWAVLKKIKTYW